MSRGQVAAIGIDAAEWSFVESLMESGDMPRLAAIRATAQVVPLQNNPNATAIAWTQFLTGNSRLPEASFYGYDPERMLPEALFGLTRDPFYARAQPLRMIAFDIPQLLPLERVDGLQVASWGSHGGWYPRSSRPRGLLREIDGMFGAHPAAESNDEVDWWASDARAERMTAALEAGAAMRGEIVPWLMSREPGWELLLTVMSETHSAGEAFYHGVDPDHPLHRHPNAVAARARLVRVYHAVDKAVGRIADALPDDATLVVFALHGMKANRGDLPGALLVPELLHRLGLGRRMIKTADADAWAAAGFPPLAPPAEQTWGGAVADLFDRPRPAPSLRDRVRSITPAPLLNARRALGNRQTPGNLKGVLGKPITPEQDLSESDVSEQRRAIDWHPACEFRGSWERMRAFALPTFADSLVRVNLAGRDRGGLVASDDYDEVCDQVASEILRCVDPRTGAPAFSSVDRLLDRAEAFSPDAYADMVVRCIGVLDAITHPTAGLVGPVPFRRTGGHTPNGFALLRGPGTVAGPAAVRPAADLVATLLELTGRKAPAGVDGVTLSGVGELVG